MAMGKSTPMSPKAPATSKRVRAQAGADARVGVSVATGTFITSALRAHWNPRAATHKLYVGTAHTAIRSWQPMATNNENTRELPSWFRRGGAPSDGVVILGAK